MSNIYYVVSKELYHHGIKGQKWGVLRFQNEDGTRTEAGKQRISLVAQTPAERKAERKALRAEKKMIRKANRVVFNSGQDAMNSYRTFSQNEAKFNKYRNKEAAGKRVNTKKYERIAKSNLKSEEVLQKSLNEIDDSIKVIGKQKAAKLLNQAAIRNATITVTDGQTYYVEHIVPEWYKENLKVADYILNRPRS